MRLLKRLCCLCCVLALFAAFLPNAVFADDKVLNIAFVGLYGSGKSALRSVAAGRSFDFLGRDPTRYTTVVERNFRYGEKDIHCRLYDTSGEKRDIDAIVHKRLEKMDIVVITIDSADKDRSLDTLWKENCVSWIYKVNEVHPEIPVLLTVTKIDSAAMSLRDLSEKCRKKKEGYEELQFDYVAVSAVRGDNMGSATSADDFGDNFWGKIRCFIRDRNMYNGLEDYEPPKPEPIGWCRQQ